MTNENETMPFEMLFSIREILSTLSKAMNKPNWDKELFLESLSNEMDAIDCELMGRGFHLRPKDLL